MKVLIIGFGAIARKHLAALREVSPEAEVIALRSAPDAPTIDGVTSVYDWQQIPRGIVFCIVSNPTYLHTEVMRHLVAMRIPIFLEKPVSNRMDGLDELASAIRNAGLPTYVACNLRFLPAIRFLRDHIAQRNPESIQEVNVYCGSYLPEWRPGTNYQESYSARTEMGGGVHLDLFHEFDYTCWILGMPASSRGFTRSDSAIHIQAADYANYQLFYGGFVAQMTLNYFRRDPKRQIEILFTDGTITADLIRNKITDQSGNVIFEDANFRIIDTYREQMKYFIHHLEGKEAPFNTFEESCQILKICLDHA